MKECFLCGRNGNGDRLERHHIFGGSCRQLSEKYGLVVYLCGERCHRNGKYSAHRSAEVAAYLHRYGQKEFIKNNPNKDFVKIFGRNYI